MLLICFRDQFMVNCTWFDLTGSVRRLFAINHHWKSRNYQSNANRNCLWQTTVLLSCSRQTPKQKNFKMPDRRRFTSHVFLCCLAHWHVLLFVFFFLLRDTIVNFRLTKSHCSGNHRSFHSVSFTSIAFTWGDRHAYELRDRSSICRRM